MGGGGAELEAVWGKGYARDKEKSGVYTNRCAAGVLEGRREIKERIYLHIRNTSRACDTSFKSLSRLKENGTVCKWIV